MPTTTFFALRGAMLLLLPFSAQFRHMLRYFFTRQNATAGLGFLTYLIAISVWLMTPQPLFLLLLALFLGLFPYIFPETTNPTQLADSPTALCLKGKWGQRLPLNKPELGVFIVGTPGCGKTKFMVEPILFQMIEKGYSGILYDYDFNTQGGRNYCLSQLAYNACRQEGKTQFFSINFQDLTRSKRINPIAPHYISDRKKLSQCLQTFLMNLTPQMAQKDDFWYKNTYALLKSLVVVLSNQYKSSCTLPHVILLGLQPVDKLMALLQTDAEAKYYASPILDAFANSEEQLAGVMSNFKVSLERLLDQDIFWVLSGDNVPHIVNDDRNPRVVALGNTPTEKALISPILAMITASLTANMYAHHRRKSFLMIDELPTLLLPDLNDVPATARKYGISTVVALQNLSQLEKRYTKIGAAELQETFGNLLIGKSHWRLAKEMSDIFGQKPVVKTSRTRAASWQTSQTQHEQEALALKPQEVMGLKTGAFVGSVAGSDQTLFRMKMRPIGAYGRGARWKNLAPLPQVQAKIDTKVHFRALEADVKNIIETISI